MTIITAQALNSVQVKLIVSVKLHCG